MKKIFLIILFIHFFSNVGKCQNAINVAKSYGDNLRMWSVTNNVSYLENIDRLRTNGTRISDDVVEYLAQKYAMQQIKTYTMESYFNWLQKEIDNGGFAFSVDSYENVGVNDLVASSTKNANKLNKYAYVKCHVRISGSRNINATDLLYIEKDKIVKIAKFETQVDKKTGRKYVQVDLSDIDFDDESIGLMYNYGPHFPLGLSVIYSIPWFSVSVDFGLSDKHGDVEYKIMKMNDIMNYEEVVTKVSPNFFLTITPSVNLKYVTIGCGAGVLSLSGKEQHEKHTFIYTDQNYSSANLKYEDNIENVKFMLRPSVKGFIPLNDELSLSLGIGYDWVFGYKKQNGLNFGVGIQYVMD